MASKGHSAYLAKSAASSEGPPRGQVREPEGQSAYLANSAGPSTVAHPPKLVAAGPAYKPGAPFPKELDAAAAQQLLNAEPKAEVLERVKKTVVLPVVDGSRFDI